MTKGNRREYSSKQPWCCHDHKGNLSQALVMACSLHACPVQRTFHQLFTRQAPDRQIGHGADAWSGKDWIYMINSLPAGVLVNIRLSSWTRCDCNYPINSTSLGRWESRSTGIYLSAVRKSQLWSDWWTRCWFLEQTRLSYIRNQCFEISSRCFDPQHPPWLRHIAWCFCFEFSV